MGECAAHAPDCLLTSNAMSVSLSALALLATVCSTTCVVLVIDAKTTAG